MAGVYSYNFMSISGLAPPQDWEFTVPQSNVAVVRQVSTYFSVPGFTTATGRLKNFETGATIVWIYYSPQNQGGQQMEGRWVFPAGSIMQFITDAAMDVTISGYLLTLP